MTPAAAAVAGFLQGVFFGAAAGRFKPGLVVAFGAASGSGRALGLGVFFMGNTLLEAAGLDLEAGLEVVSAAAFPGRTCQNKKHFSFGILIFFRQKSKLALRIQT